jgi:DNA-binding transcriptional ArsR family regulator
MEAIFTTLPAPLTETPQVELLARVFAGLSDPTRLQILLILLDGERNVSDLVSRVGASQGRVSIHLRCLRHCGFVSSERRGKYVYYRVCDPQMKALIARAQALALTYGDRLASCGVLNDEARTKEQNV